MNLTAANKTLSIKPQIPETQTQVDQVPQLSNHALSLLRDAEEKQQRNYKIIETVNLLERTFPQCFNLAAPKPLKEGIAEDLFKQPIIMVGISKAMLKSALKIYTFKKKYHKAIVREQWRYDLQGNECGQIQPSHKQFAQEWLDNKQKN